MDRIRKVLHTRYRLLPYLYQAFFQNHLTGDPILRPLLYEFEDRELENLNDQYMAGGSLMMAPIVDSGEHGDFLVAGGVRRQFRYITFPAGWWYDLNVGQWTEGGRTIRYAAAIDEVPIFAREGSVIPWYNGTLKNADTPLNDFELHVFLREQGMQAKATLYLDDCVSRKYLDGDYNTAEISVSLSGSQAEMHVRETGPQKTGGVRLDRLVFYGAPFLKTISGPADGTRELQPSERRWIAKQIAVSAAV